MDRRRKVLEWAVRLGLLAAAVFVALLVAELAVRLTLPQQLIVARPDVWQPSDTFGHIKRPGIRTTMNVGTGTVQFVTDDHGFRIGAGERHPGERRLLLLGDSFMEAREVEYEESLAGLLESHLSSQLGQDVEVWNAGVSDWEPSHYALQAAAALATDSVDLIVVGLYLGNDIVKEHKERFTARLRMVRHEFRFPRRLSTAELGDAWIDPINDKLEGNSHLYLLIKYLIQSLTVGSAVSSDYFPPGLHRRLESRVHWDTTADIIAGIAEASERSGIPTLVVLIPTVQQVDSTIAAQFMRGFEIDPDSVDVDQPTRMMSLKLAERGVEFVDPLPSFRASEEELYERVGYHLSPAGHAALADVVIPPVAEAMRR